MLGLEWLITLIILNDREDIRADMPRTNRGNGPTNSSQLQTGASSINRQMR
jgi:hypothetical protein